MQRADRAAIALEDAWERWRAMHGLGTEPLPPVSSYVGYSLEEPWGQPRVVFGLRADEAELLASLLDGHDCVGPIYSEVSTRPGWRRPVNGPASQLTRPYGSQLSVPAQAPPSPLDQLGLIGLAPEADTDDGADDLAEHGPPADEIADIAADQDAVTVDEEPAPTGKAGRPGAEPEPEPGGKEAADADESPSLAPLPEVAGFRRGEADATAGEQPQSGTTKRTTRRATVPAQGPGYRGPRYQGSPPRYDSGPARKRAEKVPESDDGEPDTEPTAPRRSAVTKLNRNTRRRASG
jgi:hypothetical protein